MGQQEATFLKSEGNKWHLRNKDKDKIDPVFDATEAAGIKPEAVIEVGCGTGWRLAKYHSKYNSYAVGIEPSLDACIEGRKVHPMVTIFRNGAAYGVKNCGETANLLIFGFCLYVVDRRDLAMIADDADAAVRDGGHLVIHDFDPDYPHKVKYHHVPGLYTYKMDYSKLWLANPAYFLVSKTQIGDGTAVWVLKKDISAGWPLEELK
jgi:SAM-dependent methyltransferase